MYRELKHVIDTTPMCDTHEHLWSEETWIRDGPDILQDLFDNYIKADLVVAGAAPEAVERALDGRDPDLAGRFRGIEKAWQTVRHTGYGEAVSALARLVYGIEEITMEALEAARHRTLELRRPGERLRLLKEVARLDHVQIDNFCWPCHPDPSVFDFFLYDIHWSNFVWGEIDPQALEQETGLRVSDLASLESALEALVAKYGPVAIALKTNHAYGRTLAWEARPPVDVSRALAVILAHPENATEADYLTVGDWCLAKGAELAIQYKLPIKIHTGYYAGYGQMPVEWIRPGHLTALFRAYPQCRFVLMHMGYPYTGELLAVAKHYPNVWVDLCWAWSIDPRSTVEFVRRFLHTAPSNKLLGFGGDTFWPTSVVAYAHQARARLYQALAEEIREGELTEKQAIAVATRWLRENQYELFDLHGTREAIQKAARPDAVKKTSRRRAFLPDLA